MNIKFNRSKGRRLKSPKINLFITTLILIKIVTAVVIENSDEYDEYAELDAVPKNTDEFRQIILNPRKRRQRRKQHKGRSSKFNYHRM